MSGMSRQILKRLAERNTIPAAFQEVSYAGADTEDARRKVAEQVSRRAGCTCTPNLYPTPEGNMLVGHQSHCVLLRMIEGQN